MGLLLAMLVLMSGSVYCATVTTKSRKPEDVISVTALAIIFILYLFYCVNLLKVGFYLVVGIAISFYVISIIVIIKKGFKNSIKEVFLKFATPGVCIFFALSVVFYFILRNRYVWLWDELRLWGAYPKALSFTNQMQLGAGDNVFLYSIMQMYAPAQPLFAYFFMGFSGFQEYKIFFAYALLGLIVLMPVLKNLTWKKPWVVVFIALLLYLLPTYFANSQNDRGDYYGSLFIDPMLGLFIAAGAYLAYKNPLKNAFKTVQFGLVTTILCLLKDSGIAFALVLFVGAIVIGLIKKEVKLKKLFVYLSISAVFVLIAIFSWRIILNHFGLRNYFVQITLSKEALVRLVKAIFTYPVVRSNFVSLNKYLTYAFFMLFLIIAMYIIWKKSKEKNRKELLVISGCMVLVNIIFVVGLWGLYSGALANPNLESYHRYISTMLTANFMFLATLVIEKIGKDSVVEKRENMFFRTIQVFVLVVFFLAAPLRSPEFGTTTFNVEEVQKHTAAILQQLDDNQYKKLFFVHESDAHAYSATHHRIYFELIDDNIFVHNFWSEVNVTANLQGDADIIVDNKKGWLEKMEQCDYLYLANYGDEFVVHYADIFVDEMQENKLYKVERTQEGIKLSLVS